MLEKLARMLKALTRQLDYSCPAQYQDDPVAQATAWTPARRGGASFCTHRLERIGADRAEFKITGGAKSFSFIFMFVGVALLIAAPFIITGPNFDSTVGKIILPGIGLVFAVVGVLLFRWMGQPIVFDQAAGYFWVGRGRPGDRFSMSKLKSLTPLSEIYAIQLVTEICHSKDSTYRSHELNLVLHDGSRVTVVDHGSAERLRTDAESLGGFLGMPVWDATNG